MKNKDEIIKKFFNRELSEEEKKDFINQAGEDKELIKSFVKELKDRSEGEGSSSEKGDK